MRERERPHPAKLPGIMLLLAQALPPPVMIVRCAEPANEPVASRTNRSIAVITGETFLVVTPLDQTPAIGDPGIVEIGTSYADDSRTFWTLRGHAAGTTSVTFNDTNRKRSHVRVDVTVSARPGDC